MAKNSFLDSSVLIGFFNPLDVHHKQAKIVLAELTKEASVFYIHPFVISESLSILKMRIDKEILKKCEQVLLNDEHFTILEDFFSFEHDASIWEYFNGKNNLSFVDAAILDYCLENGYELITFDKELEKIYKKQKEN